MSKHTSGPWKAVPTAFGPIDIVVSDGRDIVTVYGGGTGNKEANARLIAAAPDMLDAAKLAMEGIEVLDLLIASIEKHGNYSVESTLGFLNQARCGKLRLSEAIAKAEGRSTPETVA